MIPSGRLILSDKDYQQINQMLVLLLRNVGARCVFLTDTEGYFIDRVGDINDLPLKPIASLISGCVSTLQEAGRMIDGESDSINLAYREGKFENLYAINAGREFLLIVITDHGLFRSSIGSVWYYARQTATDLRQKIDEISYTKPPALLGDSVEQNLEQELEKLLAISLGI